MEKITRTDCMGKCAKCESENIDYDVVIYKGDFLFYPYECKDCNSKGNEYYNLIYTESEVDEK